MPKRRYKKKEPDFDLDGFFRGATELMREFNKAAEHVANIYDGEKKKYETNKQENKVVMMEVEQAAKILGIEPDATEDEIRAAFRTLAKKWHPDANPNNPKAQDKFIKIRAAEEVMMNATKKSKAQKDEDF